MPTTYEYSLKSSFWLFYYEVNRRYGRINTPLHDALILGLDAHPWSCWQMFRGYAKTMIAAVYRLLWKAWTVDITYGVYLSGNEPQVKDGLRKMARIAKRIEFLRKDLDHVLKFEIEFKNGSVILGKTYGSNIRGMGNEERRPNILVGDDVIPDVPTRTMEQIIDIWRKAVEPAMEPNNCELILIGTPFTPDDIYSVIEQDDRYSFTRQPIVDQDGRSVWPERYSNDMVEKIRRNIDAMTWAQQYLCMPMHPGGIEFKVEWILPWKSVPADRNRRCYVFCDLAISESKHADYAGISKWYHRDGNWYLIDAWAIKGMNDVGRKLRQLDDEPEVEVIMIEAPGALHIAISKDENFQHLTKKVIKKSVTGNKVERIGTLEPIFFNGKVFARFHQDGSPANAPYFWREYTGYNRRNPPKDLHILDGFQMGVEKYGETQGTEWMVISG
jgi:phage terminase large subunit-like protein